MMDPEKTRKFEALKIEIRSILITYKRGCTEAQLQSDYAKFNGKQLIPYGEFGCTTLLDMLRAMPDAALINNYSNPPMIHGVADEKTEHIQNLVSHQASAGSRNRGRFRMPRPSLNFRYPPPFYPGAGQASRPSALMYTPRFAPPRQQIAESRVAADSSWRVKESLTSFESKPKNENSSRKIPDITVMDLTRNDREKASKYGEQAIKVRKNIRRLLLQYSSKIILANLDQLYQSTFKQPLDRSALKIRDQTDFSEFVSDFAEVLCEDPRQYEKSLLVVKEHCTNAMELERQQDSVASRDTANEWNNVAASTIETSRIDRNNDNLDRTPHQSSLVTHTTNPQFVSTDFVYQRSNLTIDQPFLASIVEFKTTAMLSMVSMDFVQEREEMMLNLQTHYQQTMNDLSYVIPVYKMTINLACVYRDPNDGRFFRAYISLIEKSSSMKLSLCLVDYGESIGNIEVNANSNPIRYLHQDFGSFATQVYDCCLSNIEIVHDDDKATEAFTFIYDRCIEPPVVVEVVGYFDSAFSIRLWTKECEKSINDTLVERGFATAYDDRSCDTWRPTQHSLENLIEKNFIFARAFAQNPGADVSSLNQIKKYRVSPEQEFYFIRNPFNSWACLPCFQLARLLGIDEARLLLLKILRPVKLDFSADVAQLFCQLYRLTESNHCSHLKCQTRDSHIVLYDLEAIVQYLSTENFTDGDIFDAFKTEFIKSKTDEYWNEENDSYNPSHDNQLRHRIEQERCQKPAIVSPRPNAINQFDFDQSPSNPSTYEENQRFVFKPVEHHNLMIQNTNRMDRKSPMAREKMRQTLLRIARPFDRDFGLDVCFTHRPISMSQLHTIEDLDECFQDLQRITKNVSCFFRIEYEMINENDQMVLDSTEAVLDEMAEGSPMERRVEVYNHCLSIVQCLEPHIRSYVKQTEILGML